MCSGLIVSESARSAMVWATLITLKYARAERFKRSEAEHNSCSAGFSRVNREETW